MNCEFNEIANEIINNKKYIELKNESHHGINRYEHSIRVAKKTFHTCKKLKLDYVSATRAALLHDFFSNDAFYNETEMDKYKIHPIMAVNNANKYFNINSIEEEIIRTHMYPITKEKPSSKEGLIVSLADKEVSLYEYSRYKFSMQISIFILFVINIITLSNK
jgi:uncharacterized protein